VRAAWFDDTDLLVTEMELIDEQLSEAISGLGGVYAFTEDLVLGGAPGVGVIFTTDFVSFGGDVTIAGEFAVYNDVQISETLHVDGLVAFDDDLVVLGALDIGTDVQIGATLHVDGIVAFDDDLSVLGNLEVAGDQHVSGVSTLRDVAVGGDFTALGPVFLGGVSDDVDVLGTAIFRKRLAFVDSGKIEYRQKVISTDAVQSVIAAQTDTVFLPNGVFTITRAIDIDDTGATNGMRVYFHNADPTHGLQVRDPGVATLGTVLGGTRTWGFAERINGTWIWAQGEVT
jgi:hypothetical protein